MHHAGNALFECTIYRHKSTFKGHSNSGHTTYAAYTLGIFHHTGGCENGILLLCGMYHLVKAKWQPSLILSLESSPLHFCQQCSEHYSKNLEDNQEAPSFETAQYFWDGCFPSEREVQCLRQWLNQTRYASMMCKFLS